MSLLHLQQSTWCLAGIIASSNTLDSHHSTKRRSQHAHRFVYLNRAPGRNRRAVQSRYLPAAAWTALQCCSICSSSCSSSRMSWRPRLRQRGRRGLQWVAKLGKGIAGECTAMDVRGNLDRSLADGPNMVCCMHSPKHISKEKKKEKPAPSGVTKRASVTMACCIFQSTN